MRLRSVLFLGLLALAGTSAAQTPAPDARRPVKAFEETIEVQAVNLDAVVTDARGNRVTGLGVEDFRLYVDGAETPITYFAEIDEAKQLVPGEIDPGTGAPAAPPKWQNRSILVFLDEGTMMKARRNLVVRSLTRQLDQLAAGDHMAVVAFSGSQLEVVCEWTADRARLAAALAAIKERPSGGIRFDVARREELSDAAFMSLAEVQDGDQASASTARLQSSPRPRPTGLFNPFDRQLKVGEAAAGAMRGLPAPAGRKMMMLLTEGFQGFVFALPVVEEAGRLGYSLYPVDVKGIDTFFAQNDVELTTPQPFVFVTTGLDRVIDTTLSAMAEATGGKASLNSNRVAALERLVEDSASYYVIGFSPTWRGDDRRHGIHLVVNRPGLKVRTRDSYVDNSRRTRLSLEADASLLLGRSREEQRLIVNVDESASTATGNTLAISLGVPVEALAFSPREKGFHAEAPFAMVVVDEKGGRRTPQEAWLAVDVPQLPLEGTYARFRYAVAVGSRAQRVVITVHDALTGEALWGEVWLKPREKKGRKAR